MHLNAPLSPREIGRLAVRALHEELCLTPKPGLVSPDDSGSHTDMDAEKMWRGVFALRSAFTELARAGARGEKFRELRARGRHAEARLLAATDGVNTHRGALFHLGLLAAAAGTGARPDELGSWVRDRCAFAWSDDPAPLSAETTHGDRMRMAYGAGGARAEAASGYPSVFRLALPALAEASERGAERPEILTQTLFTLMATVEDTNLLYRGGPAGLTFARSTAQAWLDAGGIFAPDWRKRAGDVHHAFRARRLSPGGSADLLAAAIFVESLAFAQDHENGVLHRAEKALCEL